MEMLSDYKNYLFFEFAIHIVQEFERLNNLFQQTKTDSHELYQQIFFHQKSLQSKLYDAKRQKNSIHQVDFGVNFLTACNKYLQQNNSAEPHLEIKDVKERCMSLLEEALSQVTCRLPLVRDTFESLSNLSPVVILNQISRPMISELSFIHHAGNVSKIEEQYKCLLLIGKKKLHLRKMDSL
jgi:hypothetical protein